MAPAPQPPNLHPMNEHRIRLILDVDSADGHLTGRIGRDGEPRRPFSGRLGLMGAIDALVADDLDPNAVDVHPSDTKEPS